MLNWLSVHRVDIVLAAVVVLVAVLVVRGMIRDRKAGKRSCGACAGCPGCGACGGCSAPDKKKSPRP